MHRGGQYYQVLPHRILFPAIVMLYISIYKYKTPSKLILVLISVLAVTWNIESAVACMACMLCFVFCRSKKTFRDILMCIGIFIGSFVGAYGIVNLANISMGGKLLSFMDFIYPIMDNGYKINALAVKIPGVYGFFFFVFGLFMLLLLSGLIALFKNKLNPDIIVLMSVSLLGLGMMPYYINRAAVSNLVIVHIPLVVEISLIANVLCSGSENKSFSFKKYNKYILILLSFIFSFYDIGNVYTTFYQFYIDFGYVGVAILPFSIGVISQITYNKTKIKNNRNILNIYNIVYSYMIYALIFSFFSDKFFEEIITLNFVRYFICMILVQYFFIGINYSRKESSIVFSTIGNIN